MPQIRKEDTRVPAAEGFRDGKKEDFKLVLKYMTGDKVFRLNVPDHVAAVTGITEVDAPTEDEAYKLWKRLMAEFAQHENEYTKVIMYRLQGKLSDPEAFEDGPGEDGLDYHEKKKDAGILIFEYHVMWRVTNQRRWRRDLQQKENRWHDYNGLTKNPDAKVPEFDLMRDFTELEWTQEREDFCEDFRQALDKMVHKVFQFMGNTDKLLAAIESGLPALSAGE
jgi:hypothetical protein